eukprot:1141330-Pelagomonas_calceolata.AAC.9
MEESFPLHIFLPSLKRKENDYSRQKAACVKETLPDLQSRKTKGVTSRSEIQRDGLLSLSS